MSEDIFALDFGGGGSPPGIEGQSLGNWFESSGTGKVLEDVGKAAGNLLLGAADGASPYYTQVGPTDNSPLATGSYVAGYVGGIAMDSSYSSSGDLKAHRVKRRTSSASSSSSDSSVEESDEELEDEVEKEVGVRSSTDQGSAILKRIDADTKVIQAIKQKISAACQKIDFAKVEYDGIVLSDNFHQNLKKLDITLTQQQMNYVSSDQKIEKQMNLLLKEQVKKKFENDRTQMMTDIAKQLKENILKSKLGESDINALNFNDKSTIVNTLSKFGISLAEREIQLLTKGDLGDQTSPKVFEPLEQVRQSVLNDLKKAPLPLASAPKSTTTTTPVATTAEDKKFIEEIEKKYLKTGLATIKYNIHTGTSIDTDLNADKFGADLKVKNDKVLGSLAVGKSYCITTIVTESAGPVGPAISHSPTAAAPVSKREIRSNIERADSETLKSTTNNVKGMEDVFSALDTLIKIAGENPQITITKWPACCADEAKKDEVRKYVKARTGHALEEPKVDTSTLGAIATSGAPVSKPVASPTAGVTVSSGQPNPTISYATDNKSLKNNSGGSSPSPEGKSPTSTPTRRGSSHT